MEIYIRQARNEQLLNRARKPFELIARQMILDVPKVVLLADEVVEAFNELGVQATINRYTASHEGDVVGIVIINKSPDKIN